MTSGDDKWIRSIKDNPAGKVISDDADGNRWEWDQSNADGTSRLLRKLENHELSIEHTDIKLKHPSRRATSAEQAAEPTERRQSKVNPKRGSRDAGGGFDPYNSSGKPRR
jgi:hypothetical protein